MSNRVKAITPAKAARLRRRDEQQRREKRLTRWLLIGVVCLMVGAVVADWLFIQFARRQRHMRQYHQGQTNAPAHIPAPGATNRTPAT